MTIDPEAHSGVRSAIPEAVRGTPAPGAFDEPVSGAESQPTSGAALDVRPVDAACGVIITVTGALEAGDAATLTRCLQTELDRNPKVVVIDLSGVPTCDSATVEVLTAARLRSRREDIALHLVHLGAPAARAWLAAATLS